MGKRLGEKKSQKKVKNEKNQKPEMIFLCLIAVSVSTFYALSNDETLKTWFTRHHGQKP